MRLFSLRHEFPNEWARFTSVRPLPAGPFAELTLHLRKEHYPFWSLRTLKLTRVDIFAQPSKTTKPTITVGDKAVDDGERKEDVLTSQAGGSLGKIRSGNLENIKLPPATDTFILYFNDTSMEDLWLGLAWSKGDDESV